MSRFVMKNRPKKPMTPSYVSQDVGNYVSFAYLMECYKKFRAAYPGLDVKQIMVEAGLRDYHETHITLTAPPEAHSVYEGKLSRYKAELKVYEDWRKKHKKQIEQHKAAQKKVTAKRKLEKKMEALTKELEQVETRLAQT